MVQRLLYRGANLDHVNKQGKTALHLCVEQKNVESIKYLLFKGADQHILDLNEKDCCDKAKENGLAV
jgi:ankyrin repeat protein